MDATVIVAIIGLLSAASVPFLAGWFVVRKARIDHAATLDAAKAQAAVQAETKAREISAASEKQQDDKVKRLVDGLFSEMDRLQANIKDLEASNRTIRGDLMKCEHDRMAMEFTLQRQILDLNVTLSRYNLPTAPFTPLPPPAPAAPQADAVSAVAPAQV